MSETTLKHIKSGMKKLKRSLDGLEHSQQSIVGKLNNLVDTIEKFDRVNEEFTKKYNEFAEKRGQKVEQVAKIISEGMEQMVNKTLKEIGKEKMNSFLEYPELTKQMEELRASIKLKYQQMAEAEKAVGVAFENMRREQAFINDTLLIKMDTNDLLNLGGPVVMKLSALKQLFTEAQSEYIRAKMQLVNMEQRLNDVELNLFKATINHVMSAITDLYQRDTILGSLTILSGATTNTFLQLMMEYNFIMESYEVELDRISEEKEIIENVKIQILNSEDGELLQKAAGLIANGKSLLNYMELLLDNPPIIVSTNVIEANENGKEMVEIVQLSVEGLKEQQEVKLKYKLKRKASREKKLVLSLVKKMYESRDRPG
ncbi:hypothetical protein NAEGRDRAFT_57334 [Naegleria gruberi]|uniref:Uncharacterized protein n=1 Tax=Naegleria gruberi TaxID=5762 RepID=D2V6Z1_NAEGR|nr:uncharacterized protein NAEGRDRAFT_57334 [Naegleria gruberi]EFC47652.1 hypothetical protein NAEGRDRAFT_57334 [Naegleria gruberi]|eukprot:XP_002680396.1 hypothetical protein NAEGRDRAFT_57334 [Naegleria gruberi strain NEG-M]